MAAAWRSVSSSKANEEIINMKNNQRNIHYLLFPPANCGISRRRVQRHQRQRAA